MYPRNETYFQNIVSILGLIAAFVAALLPAFSIPEIRSYFINPNSAIPLTIITVVVGVIAAWNIIENYRQVFIQIPRFGKSTPRVFTTRHIVWFLLLIIVASFTVFFVSMEMNWGAWIQYIAYPIFFSSIFSGFSLLIAESKSKYDERVKRDSLPANILATMEKNGLINTKLKIIENQVIRDFAQINDLGIQDRYEVRIVAVKMENKIVNAVLSEDGTELIRHNENAET